MSDYIEQDCTIEHEGRRFTAAGALITDDYLIAYPIKDNVLADWHGNPIGTYTIISSRPAIFFGHVSHWSTRYYYMHARLHNGARYILRGFGNGCIAKGKRLKD